MEYLPIQYRKPFEEEAQIDQRVKGILAKVGLENRFTTTCFRDPKLFYALPESVRESEEIFADFILNSEKFNSIIPSERLKVTTGQIGLLGENVVIPESRHGDGRKRREEFGEKINIDYLKTLNIDPSKVLFFRLTQPSDGPKPEYYWTSDYREVVQGLTAEIDASQRQTAIILIASLDSISKANDGLIQDINDDSGLAVRQIGTQPFNQNLALGKIFL